MITLEGAQILIVDDVVPNIQTLGTTLRNEGYRIIVAQSGDRALDTVHKTRPDLILLDVMMPGLNGFETCKRLKADPNTKEIPIIFLTAKTESDDVVKGFDLGAIDYIAKPFNAQELLVRVRTHLTLQKTREALEQRLHEIATMKREQEAFLRHELNNRLTPISGYTYLLKSQADGLDGEQLNWISIIEQSVKDMGTLIEELRKLQDFEAGHMAQDIRPVDLPSMISRVKTNLEMAFAQAVDISIDNTLDNGIIKADANLLMGVFENLIKNGAEHVMGLEDEAERRVKISMDHENGYVVVRVNNRGEPVPPGRLATFFEKFNTDRSKKEGGTGLGTTYAYLVTRAHDGEISVTSDETDGTTLTVKLPQP